MVITACPKCGSRKIFQGRLKEGVLTGYTPKKYVCSECGYQGNPIIFDSLEEYKKFLKEFKSGKKEKNSDEKIDSLTKKDKEVLKYLKDTEKELKFEKHPKIFKNSFVWIGIVVLVVGIWISSRGGFSPLFGISLFFVGIILLLVGFFTPREEISITKSSKPTFGGIFLMMAGVLGIFTWIDFFSLIDESINDPLFMSQFGLDASYEMLESIFLICGITGIIFSILAILGGILAIKRKYCILSIVCGFFGVLVIGPLFSSTILSLLGIVFIYRSKKSFDK